MAKKDKGTKSEKGAGNGKKEGPKNIRPSVFWWDDKGIRQRVAALIVQREEEGEDGCSD